MYDNRNVRVSSLCRLFKNQSLCSASKGSQRCQSLFGRCFRKDSRNLNFKIFLSRISYTVLKLSKGALDKNRDLFLEWIVNNIASQRLLDKIIRMVENQNENIKEFMKNKYSRACGNSHHPLDQVNEFL